MSQVTAPMEPFQAVVRAAYSPLPTNSTLLVPTRSLVVAPTRLLAADTTPVMPVSGSAQVMAPASTAAPLSQFGLRMPIRLPMLLRPELPTASPAVEPTRLLVASTTPTVPDVVSNQVTAPRPAFQLLLVTSILPLNRFCTLLPT